ncbi:competence protein CoiA family protein [Mesobacillus subterraneus]|uniref:competence protein CoiA family protein n=1 Tax=Mesobacillus subterraneus TaxID=285983 RepID=UPI001CFD13E4|nr:competence protein CoiA family protein [Mesobacillus subterraneus]WLR54602.1 competence protein CoiA family protein [Mesobacillus subterraneus]
MREALHVIDKEVITLPHSTDEDRVNNLKKLAQKNLFVCPYCQAKLIVKAGDERGLYFSHLHSEACEPSKKVDQAERKYKRQIERETKNHTVIVNILHDEISTQAKIRANISVKYGYKAKFDLKEYPDIWVKIGAKEFALSVITNVSSSYDSKLSNQIIKRHQYFEEQGMEPIWFIEKKEQSVELEKNAIVLWDAELAISSKTEEDHLWDSLLSEVIEDREFFTYFNYPFYNESVEIDVRSMYYIYSSEDRVVVKVQRFLKDRTDKPYRSFLLNSGYEIPFSEALTIKDEFLLSNSNSEDEHRKNFLNKYQQAKESFIAEQRRQEEEKQQEKEKKRQLLQQLLDQKQHTSPSKIGENLSYADLKILLREKIHLKQREQMELWNYFMPRIGLNNSALVWNLVVEHGCTTFDELRNVLKSHLR